MNDSRVRTQVVELLAYLDMSRSDFASRPRRLVHLEGGRPFTAAESALANSATPDEIAAAQRLAAAAAEREQRKTADYARAMELMSAVPG